MKNIWLTKLVLVCGLAVAGCDPATVFVGQKVPSNGTDMGQSSLPRIVDISPRYGKSGTVQRFSVTTENYDMTRFYGLTYPPPPWNEKCSPESVVVVANARYDRDHGSFDIKTATGIEASCPNIGLKAVEQVDLKDEQGFYILP